MSAHVSPIVGGAVGVGGHVHSGAGHRDHFLAFIDGQLVVLRNDFQVLSILHATRMLAVQHVRRRGVRVDSIEIGGLEWVGL